MCSYVRQSSKYGLKSMYLKQSEAMGPKRLLSLVHYCITIRSVGYFGASAHNVKVSFTRVRKVQLSYSVTGSYLRSKPKMLPRSVVRLMSKKYIAKVI